MRLPSKGSRRRLYLLVGLSLLAACHPPQVGLSPLEEPARLQAAPARINGAIPGTSAQHGAFLDLGTAVGSPLPAAPAAPAARAAQEGDVTLNFADTDIREVVRVILGTTLKLNYTIDPKVQGTATLDTDRPLPRSALLSTLETLLNQDGATLV